MRSFLIAIIILIMLWILWFLRGPVLVLKRRKEERIPEKNDSEKIGKCLEILGLKSGASQEEINQAYRDLVNVWHPDRFANNQRLRKKAEEKLKEINASYEYIKSFHRLK